MPLFNVYSGSGQTFSLECRTRTDDAHDAVAETVQIDDWTKQIANFKEPIGPGEIVRDNLGREWFAVRVN